MRRVLTADDARELEADAVRRGTPVEALMERAGHAVARAAVDVAGGAYGRRAVVVCGTGNNAGDGFVAARQLARWGMGVTVLLAGKPAGEPAETNLERLRWGTVRVARFTSAGADRELARADVVIDAIFGLGLRGRPKGALWAAIDALGKHAVPCISVDIASGVEADTAAVLGAAVRAAVTVTFGAPKIGNLLPPGGALAGRLEVADIYEGALLGESDDWSTTMVEDADVSPPAPRTTGAHKRDAVVLVVAGSRRMTGAPALVADGAYRAGAGLVTIAVPESILPIVQGSIREATFLPLPEGPEGAIAEAAADVLQERIPECDAVALGPGLSTDGAAPAIVAKILRTADVPVVADADAINAFVGRPQDLADRKGSLVITPHAGELARLMDRSVDAVEADPLGSVRAAAATIDAPVLLKGWRTLVGEVAGRVRITSTGTPALATAGTGDVLTGVIAAFAARSDVDGAGSIEDAAVAGAHVHGVAGSIAGASLGEGTTASDVAAAIPAAVRRAREASG